MPDIPQRHRETAARHSAGAIIEVQHQSGSAVWLETLNPLWQQDRNYRVKPPLTTEELAYLAREAEKLADANAQMDRQRLAVLEEKQFLQSEEFKRRVEEQERVVPGRILQLTAGSYDDYTTVCYIRALKPFGTIDVGLQFVAQGAGTIDDFVSWLIAQGLVDRLPENEVLEWWMGDWNRPTFKNGA